MRQELTVSYDGASDRGLKRTDNQDYYGKFPRDDLDLTSPKGQLFIVADGLGGHRGGRTASEMAVDLIQQSYFAFPSDDIQQGMRLAMETANYRIFEQSAGSSASRGMGTTSTALVLKDDRAYVAHVGDSRAYCITRSKIEQFTKDHSKVAEMQRLGILTEEEARNHPDKSHLYRALGIASTIEIDVIDGILLTSGMNFLLCTDGMAAVEAGEMQGIVLSHSPQQACQVLIELANARGGADNATVMVVKVE